MDVFMPIALCVIFIILFTICGWCCKRKREGTVYGYGPSVTVTSTTQHVTPPQVVPPYPTDPRHPTPATNAPGPGFATHRAPYPTHSPNMPFPQTALQPYGLPPPPMGITGAPPFHNGYFRPVSSYGQAPIWSSGYSPTSMTVPMPIPRPMNSYTPWFQNGATPYPPAGPTPYPPAPYPPAGHDYSANPPPYDVAVSQPPMQPSLTKEGYGKQAPYNPGYN